MPVIRCCNGDDCVNAGRELDLRHAWQRVVGWEQPRAQGGTNHVALRETRDEFMCDGCMRLARSGIPRGQGTLV